MNSICTISDQGYSSKAFAMLETASEIMPDLELFFLDIEGCQPKYPVGNIRILSLKEIGFSSPEIENLRNQYNVIEFATAVKPFLMEALLSQGFQTVTYVDPDVLLVSPIWESLTAAQQYDAVVTPHRLTPCLTEHLGLEIELNRVGVFNLGFITVSQNSFELLKWWKAKTINFASMNWFKGQFTDQKWVDFFPVYFNPMILRHPGYNVAIWNIDERPLAKTEFEIWTAGDQPLRFVHFSQGSHLLDNSAIRDRWQSVSSIDLNSVITLAGQYRTNIDKVEKMLTFAPTPGANLRLSRPKYRLNAKDGFVEGLKMDFEYLRSRLPR